MVETIAPLPQLIVSSQLEDSQEAQRIAKDLQLPYQNTIALAEGGLIQLPSGWAVKLPDDRKLWQVNWQQYLHEYRHNQGKHLLWRACGFKQPNRLTVVDATAGWGRDACMLAMRAKALIMIEQNKVIHWLLADGIKRLCDPLVERLTLIQGDAKTWLLACKEPVDVIYLDPMYPLRDKWVLSKKAMQIAKFLVTELLDPSSLLDVALQVARYRVVVKRPLWAQSLTMRQPDFKYSGRRCRYDVYQVEHNATY